MICRCYQQLKSLFFTHPLGRSAPKSLKRGYLLYNIMEEEKVLLKNILEFYRNGLDTEKRGDFNSSVTLFFKALAVLGDLYILRKEGKIPNSHSERFRILEEKYHGIYKILDKDFLLYQNSYRIKLDKENSEVIKKDVEQLLELLEVRK